MIVGLVDSLGPREDWHQEAICSQVDPEIFWPEKTRGKQHQRITDAKKVCAACPVSQQCLDYALRNHEAHGIWGGLTERERRRYRLTGRPKRTHCQRGHNLERVGVTANGSCRGCRAIYDREGRERRQRSA